MKIRVLDASSVNLKNSDKLIINKVKNHMGRHAHREPSREKSVFTILFFWEYIGEVKNKSATCKQSMPSDLNMFCVTQDRSVKLI